MYLCILYHVLNAICNICIIYFTRMKIKFVLHCLLMQTDLCIFNELCYEQITNGFFCLNDIRHDRKIVRNAYSSPDVFVRKQILYKI